MKKRVYITKDNSFVITTPYKCPFRDSYVTEKQCMIDEHCYTESSICPLEDA